MGRFLLRVIIIPTMLCWCPTLTAITALDTDSVFSNWVMGYFLAMSALIIGWWGIGFSRWLHNKYMLDSIPYFISNIVIGLCFFVLGLAVAVVLVDGESGKSTPIETVGALFALGGLLLGIGWSIRSIGKWVSSRNKQHQGIHWWPLVADRYAFRQDGKIVRPLPSVNSALETDGNHLPGMERSKRHTKATDTIFRPVITENTHLPEVRGIPIPPPRHVVPPGSQKTRLQQRSPTTRDNANVFVSSPQVSISFSSPRTSFVEQAKRYVNRTESKAEQVPFMQYWPTYDAMSASQLKWYFYWRTQVRQRNFLPADMSYLFVHIYEALNLVGFPSPRDSFNHLVRFWKHYRILQPKLDNYLIDWLADFIVVYGSPVSPLKFYGLALQEGAISHDIDLSIEAWVETGSDFQTLPMSLLFKLAAFNPTKSKFYLQHGQELLLNEAYRDGLAAVEQALREDGNSLFKIYCPPHVRTIQRAPFASALHDLKIGSVTIGDVHPWSRREDLALTLASIMKYVENIKRTQANQKSRLRGIEMSSDWISILDRAFAQSQPRREIVIDMAKVAQLKQESEEIRERLLVEPETSRDKPGLMTTHEIALEPEKVDHPARESEEIQKWLTVMQEEHAGPSASDTALTTRPQFVQRPVDAPAGMLTDLQGVADVMGKADGSAAKILRFMYEKEWVTSLADIPKALYSGNYLSVELDMVNDRASRKLGDALLFEEDNKLIVNEDYRDEIAYILQHPDYKAELHGVESYNDLSDEWAQFAHRMQPQHWEALAAILQGLDVQVRLDAIARSAFSTATLLVDEINMIAQDCIGDIVIDTDHETPQIEEEDIEGLQALVVWAMQKRLVEA